LHVEGRTGGWRVVVGRCMVVWDQVAHTRPHLGRVTRDWRGVICRVVRRDFGGASGSRGGEGTVFSGVAGAIMPGAAGHTAGDRAAGAIGGTTTGEGAGTIHMEGGYRTARHGILSAGPFCECLLNSTLSLSTRGKWHGTPCMCRDTACGLGFAVWVIAAGSLGCRLLPVRQANGAR
jgi:hypothetical protein